MNLNSSMMGLSTEDHLQGEVPFDDDEGLPQNIPSYPLSDIQSLDSQNSSILTQHHPSLSDFSSSRAPYNAKYPPQLQRRLPRAFPLATVQNHPGSTHDIMAQHDDNLHSPLAQEQPHPNHDLSSVGQDYPPQQMPLHGLSMPGLQSKPALIPHIQAPLQYQFAGQMPQPSMQGQPQLINITHMPQQYPQMPQYTQHLAQLLPPQPTHQPSQVLSSSMPITTQLPQMSTHHHQHYLPPLQGMHEPPYQNSPYAAQKRPSEDDISDGTKQRVAPRRADLFRVGPPFSGAVEHCPIFRGDTHERLTPHIEARIDRGFELAGSGNWIGYKRNYFTMVVAFDLGIDFSTFTNSTFYTSRNLDVGTEDVPINYFALNIEAKCSDIDAQVSLVQHTPKRDKGPQNAPPIFPAVPGRLPDHETVKESCNKRNDTKLELMNKIFNFDRDDFYSHQRLNQNTNNSVLNTYPHNKIARVARFERIQFTKSIRTKVTTMQHKYFTLHAELVGVLGSELEEEHVVLASSKTPGLLVRGRSPSKYHTEKTSGYRGPSDSENYSM